MSPALTISLTFCGVLLAGLPLLHLTAEAPRRMESADPTTETPSTKTVFARIRFTGQPLQATLRFEGQDIAAMPDGCHSTWETELQLPQQQQLELEAEIHWADGSPENAVSITLEPPQQEAVTDTRWTGPDGALLHDLFLFSW